MNKTLLLAGIVGLTGVGVVLIMKKKSAASVGNQSPNVQNSGLLDFLGSGFGYPFKMPAKGRVDNQNQPYANGSKIPVGPYDSNGMQKAAQDIGAGSSIIHSISDIWGSLGAEDWFGGSTVDSSDDTGYIDWNYAMDSSGSEPYAGDFAEHDDSSFDDSSSYEYEVA